MALVQAGQMGPWREKAMGKRLVLFWQAWSSHTNQPCESMRNNDPRFIVEEMSDGKSNQKKMSIKKQQET